MSLTRMAASSLVTLTVALVAILALPEPGLAQVGAEALGRQSLRPYWFVFIAYAVVWVLVFGWVVSISRRLAKLDGDLAD